MTTTTVEQLHAEVYPAPETVMAEVYPTIETVQAELDLMREEMEMADYWQAKYHLQIDGGPLQEWDRVTRRRWVQQFTRKQIALGEEILRGIQNRKIGNA